MVDIGDMETTILLAQNWKLKMVTIPTVGTSPSTSEVPLVTPGTRLTTPDDLLLMRQLRFIDDPPEARTNHGQGRTYQHGASDIGLSFILSASSDVLRRILLANKRKDSGYIPIRTWRMEGTDNQGVNVATMTFNAKLTRKELEKSDNEQETPSDLSVFLRITDDNIDVALSTV